MSIELKQLYAGGTEQNKTKIKARVNFPDAEPVVENNLKVYTIQYKWPTSPGKLRIWCNDEVVEEVDATDVHPYFYNLLIGGDQDNLNGYICESMFYKTGYDSLSDAEITAYNRWLADKWLETGIDFNGHTVQSSEGTEPTFTNGGNGGVEKWLHFDESTIVDDGGGNADAWNDKAAFNGVAKSGVYYDYPTTNKLPIESSGKNGKNVIRFNGDNFFKMSVQNGGANDPDDPSYLTIWVVAKFDDFDSNSNQTIFGSITNSGTWNIPLRFKKYANETDLALRMQIGGSYRTGYVPRNKVIEETIPQEQTAPVRVGFTTDENFVNDIVYTPIKTASSNNKGALLFDINGLDEDVNYYVRAEIDGNLEAYQGKFKTFKKHNPQSFSFVFGSCNYSNSNHQIWEAIRQKNPDLFIHLGDLHYEDIGTNDIDLFRDAFNSTVEQANQQTFYSNQNNYYVWDDHDFGPNNSDKNNPAREAAISFFLENVPIVNVINDPETNGVSQYWDIGRTRFIMSDNRSNRDDWTITPYTDPNKSVLGSTTKQWFKDLLLDYKSNPNLDVCFWMNPFGWSGDENNPYSWSYQRTTEVWSVYLAEREELANFMFYNQIPNVVICNGDTHMLAIDDGRNNFYATDQDGNKVDIDEVPEELRHVIIESSPFDKDPDKQNGQFQITDQIDSGGPYPSGGNVFSLITLNDLGSNWIELVVEQFGYYSFYEGGTELYKVREFKKQYNTKLAYNNTPAPAKFEDVYRIDNGSIQVNGANHSLLDGFIDITSPSYEELTNAYKGEITGTVSGVTISAGSHQIQYYRRSDMDYLIQTVNVQTDGSFTIDPSLQSGSIVLKLYDVDFAFVVSSWENDGNSIDKWTDLEIHKFVTTDADYLEDQFLAPYNNQYQYRFTYEEGFIKYKLYRVSDDTYVAEAPIKTDLPRSYIIPETETETYNSPFVHRNYLYDSALSLISATGLKDFDLADKIIDGILKAQFPSGAFPFSVNHSSPNYSYTDAYFRVGAIAWVVYALGFYLEYRRSPNNRNQIETAINDCLNYIASLENNSVGLPTGGSGRYESEVFNPSYQIGWISTEHCIDYYFALKQAGKVLKNSDYKNKANSVKNLMLSELWDSANERFYQGISDASTNTKDTADALDCNSWGYIFLRAIGEPERGQNLLNRLEQYYYVEDVGTGAKGYKPYSDQWGYPSAVDNVWFEGSFGVALAYWRARDYTKYNQILEDLKLFEEEDGSYKYAVLRDETYEISNYKSIASTAWYVIASKLKNTVWR